MKQNRKTHKNRPKHDWLVSALSKRRQEKKENTVHGTSCRLSRAAAAVPVAAVRPQVAWTDDDDDRRGDLGANASAEFPAVRGDGRLDDGYFGVVESAPTSHCKHV